MPRNFSVHDHFQALAARHRPQFRFDGKDASAWSAWREQLHPRILQSLGTLPQATPLNPECIVRWEADGLIKEKIVFDVEEGLSAEAYVFRPANGDGPWPGILCCHGHGPFGKEPVMGNRSTKEMSAAIDQHNYDYGLKMSQAGFVTIAIDWRGFGARDDRGKPHHRDLTRHGPRDQCNLHQIRAQILGRSMLGMNIHDGKCALDYLAQLPYVNRERLGVMGLSLGGTMTTWMAVCDPRIKAADIICYSDRFADFAIRDVNFCGSQITQGLYAMCDVPDLQGLIAPRPLLVEIGTHDGCFRIESAMSCYRELEKIYRAAGASEKLELDLFPGGHVWGGNKSVAFFRKHLA
jgi:dienelactone hydrolase